MKRLAIILLAVVVAGAGGYWLYSRNGSAVLKNVRFKTAPVDRGVVIQAEAASGAVQPVELVQVGTQISGTIEKLFVDFNSRVRAGEVIARLDSRRLAAQVAQDEAVYSKARADLERLKAAVLQSRADVERARSAVDQAKAEVSRVEALLTQAQAELERQRQLVERRLTSRSDFDAATANAGALAAQRTSALAAVTQAEKQLSSVEAALRQNEASVTVGEAAIRQAKALLEGDRVNLGYATIVSPVSGVVVSRNVEVGQTVAASLQAPVLFTIARDLTKIQIETSVPEASIGRTFKGQAATFTVDAYPDRTFQGTVSQVRLAPTTVSNVVTYTVVVTASNPDGLLFPGMTANVNFEVARSAEDALRVPSSALRVQPPDELVEGRNSNGTSRRGREKEAGESRRKDGDGKRRGEGKGGRGAPSFVYVQTASGLLKPIPVTPGISDGIKTVVEPRSPGALTEGAEVVTAILKEAEETTKNPFGPPRFGGPRSGGAGRR